MITLRWNCICSVMCSNARVLGTRFSWRDEMAEKNHILCLFYRFDVLCAYDLQTCLSLLLSMILCPTTYHKCNARSAQYVLIKLQKKKSSFFSLFIESNDDLNDVWHFPKSDCVGNSIRKKETKYFVFTSDFDFNILLFQMINDELLLTCVQVCRHHRA